MPIAWGYERLRPEPPGASAREDWVPGWAVAGGLPAAKGGPTLPAGEAT